jgi:hypothetical protein
MVTLAMKLAKRRIVIELSAQDHAALGMLARRLSLDVNGLLALLARDAAAVVRRPRSWQAISIRFVLIGHGYDPRGE